MIIPLYENLIFEQSKNHSETDGNPCFTLIIKELIINIQRNSAINGKFLFRICLLPINVNEN